LAADYSLEKSEAFMLFLSAKTHARKDSLMVPNKWELASHFLLLTYVGLKGIGRREKTKEEDNVK
jgi:hypothetical protein